MLNVQAKPFLKWAGGKKWLVPHLLEIIPKTYGNYFEPFLGGGALFFAIRPKRAFLSDINVELINAYQSIRADVDSVVARLCELKYGKEVYYGIRNQRYSDNYSRAARFIYLNRTCWNGLYRENKSGEFNVPMGKYANPLICDRANLQSVSKALQNTDIVTMDFEDALAKARKGDLIYLDPPYVTGHKNNGFIGYNSKIFKWEKQKRLKALVEALDKSGCSIILSNAEHDEILKLYSNFNVRVVNRHSIIAGRSLCRKRIGEYLITNF